MEPACLKGMKVIIRDARTQNYLSADGGWVRSRDDAGDFFTLLRAYHFAARHTSGRSILRQYRGGDGDREGRTRDRRECGRPGAGRVAGGSALRDRQKLPELGRFGWFQSMVRTMPVTMPRTARIFVVQ